VFERHPHVFYLLLKEKTCFVVLKEAYMARGDTAIEEHPMLEVRKKFVELMEQSQEIIRAGSLLNLNPMYLILGILRIALKFYHNKPCF
jgi:hypothetical protein